MSRRAQPARSPLDAAVDEIASWSQWLAFGALYLLLHAVQRCWAMTDPLRGNREILPAIATFLLCGMVLLDGARHFGGSLPVLSGHHVRISVDQAAVFLRTKRGWAFSEWFGSPDGSALELCSLSPPH